MNITECKSYDSMSELAASLIMRGLESKPDLLLCAATGSSPTGLYKILVEKSKNEMNLFKNLRLVKLDEWGGVKENDPVTCEWYIRQNLIEPLNISFDRYISFESEPADPEAECKRIQNELDQKGPIDICILGIGKNGHIGFNEPDDYLAPGCHYARLTSESLSHSMIQVMDKKPSYGLTLGMGDILNSSRIILLITGNNKKDVTNQLMRKKVSTDLPASFLWLHPHVDCFIDLSSV